MSKIVSVKECQTRCPEMPMKLKLAIIGDLKFITGSEMEVSFNTTFGVGCFGIKTKSLSV